MITNPVIRLISGIIYVIFFIYTLLNSNPIILYVFVSLLLIGSIYELMKMTYKYQYYIKIIMIIYITTSFVLFLKIHQAENGKILTLFLMTQIWASDVGGYIIGSIFGKNKFLNISPTKSYEGIVGSFIFCLSAIFLFQNQNLAINLLLSSIIITTSSILGDLIISKIKRIHNHSDSGFFLPGHGGFLDRLDSFFLATPIFYFVICK